MNAKTRPSKRPRDPNQLVKAIVDIATGETEDREPEKNESAAELGAA